MRAFYVGSKHSQYHRPMVITDWMTMNVVGSSWSYGIVSGSTMESAGQARPRSQRRSSQEQKCSSWGAAVVEGNAAAAAIATMRCCRCHCCRCRFVVATVAIAAAVIARCRAAVALLEYGRWTPEKTATGAASLLQALAAAACVLLQLLLAVTGGHWKVVGASVVAGGPPEHSRLPVIEDPSRVQRWKKMNSAISIVHACESVGYELYVCN